MNIDYNNIELWDTSSAIYLGGGSAPMYPHQITPRVAKYLIESHNFKKEAFVLKKPMYVLVGKDDGIVKHFSQERARIYTNQVIVDGVAHTEWFAANIEEYAYRELMPPQLGVNYKEWCAQFKRTGGDKNRIESEFAIAFDDKEIQTTKPIRRLKVYGIYFSEQTRVKVEPVFTPYYNQTCTKYFENDVIIDVVLNRKHEWQNFDYVGVLSYQFASQRRLHWFDVTRHLNAKKFNQKVYSFWDMGPHPVLRSHLDLHTQMFNIAHHILVKRMGIDSVFLTRNSPSIFRNYWIATPELYEAYVKEFLIPIMQIMEDRTDAELQTMLFTNANYFKSTHMPREFLRRIFEGREYYTHHTFVLERMASIYFGMKDIQVELIRA